MNYSFFHKLFLTEMPVKLNGSNDFGAQLEMIRENLLYNPQVTNVAPDVYKTENGTQITYWYGDQYAKTVQLIVDVNVHGNFVKVELTSKNPSIPTGNPPYASDLYTIIKDDSKNKNLVLTSDQFLSDEGARLLSTGHHIGVYDTKSNRYVLTSVENAGQLSQYIGDFPMAKYIFVISESIQEHRGVKHAFALLELKRNCGYPLFKVNKY
jgi:hypothetical protein